MFGKIVKGIAGFYYVYVEEKGLYECKAKGIFRNKSIKPLVGDNVQIDIIDEEERLGNITEILKRDNELVRPAVANVDQAMVVFSMKSPTPNLNLLDRFLVMMEFQNIDTIICFNKKDICKASDEEYMKKIYNNAGYRVLFTSALKNEGIPEVREFLLGKTTVFAGPSGVGKSSMLNTLALEEKMQTGEVSRKIGRGKHTTRHSEIFHIESGTFVIDTPGFTSLNVPGMDENILEACFPEFITCGGECRFTGCAHRSEPECRIRKAVAEEKISKERYENYCLFYEELKNRKKY